MDLALLKELHAILEPYDNICPRECFLCEVNETAVMLPNEEKLISIDRKPVRSFIRHEEGFYYLDMRIECPHFALKDKRGVCLVYDERPLDCRIFPFYPKFNLEDNSYILLKSEEYCPISKHNHSGMERSVRIVLDIINVVASKAWKQTYNRLNYQRLSKNSAHHRSLIFSCTI